MAMENSKINYFNMFFQLTRRHLLVFFRNKVRVFFTLMVPFIIFAIYILFLRALEMNTARSVLTELEEQLGASFTGDAQLQKHIGTVIDSWMLSGIIAISTITVSLQTNTIIVSDRENGINRDFASSPISRNLLIASYFLFNIIVTVFICFIFLLVCLLYLMFMGEFVLTFVDFLAIFAILVYSSVVSVLLTVFICSFISRDSTMASINTIISTAVGFIIGAYLPIGAMPAWARNVSAFFPGTFSCSLLRYSFMSTPIAKLTGYVSTLNVAGASEIIDGVTASFGYNFIFFGKSVAPGWQALVNLIFIAILIVANVLAANKLVLVLGSVGKQIKKVKKGADKLFSELKGERGEKDNPPESSAQDSSRETADGATVEAEPPEETAPPAGQIKDGN